MEGEEIDYNCDEYLDEYMDEDIDNIDENEQQLKKQANNNDNKINIISEYEILKNDEFIKKRDLIIEKFMECSCLGYDEAELVLLYYNWDYDKLTEVWYDEMGKIKIESHIEQSPESIENIKKFYDKNQIPENQCLICLCDLEKEDSISLKCNHYLCSDCYKEYINTKLENEPLNILNTPCPLNGCNLYVTRSIFKKCVTEKKKQKIFAKSLVKNFIFSSKDIKLCPNQECNKSVRVLGSKTCEIKCTCGYFFCFNCLQEAHKPCDCEMVKIWLNYTKIRDNGIDLIWIKNNTKECPKCKSPIEKNHGCNHMICRRSAGGCGYEFCWVCMGSWKSHIIEGLFSYYNCKKIIENNGKDQKKEKNKYIPGKTKEKLEKNKLNEMDRYIKYYEGWENHERSFKICSKLNNKIDEYKNILNSKKMINIEELQFLDETLNTVKDCHRLLKYSFVFAYFMKDDVNMTLFEHNQEILEHQADMLNEMIELEQLPDILKIENEEIFKENFFKYKDRALRLLNSTNNYKNGMLQEIDNNLFDKIDYDRIKIIDLKRNK